MYKQSLGKTLNFTLIGEVKILKIKQQPFTAIKVLNNLRIQKLACDYREKYIDRHNINWYDTFEVSIPTYVQKLEIFKAGSYPSKTFEQKKNLVCRKFCIGTLTIYSIFLILKKVK